MVLYLPNILEMIHCAIDETYLIIVFPNGETAPNDVGLSMVAFSPNSNTDGRLFFANSYFIIQIEPLKNRPFLVTLKKEFLKSHEGFFK